MIFKKIIFQNYQVWASFHIEVTKYRDLTAVCRARFNTDEIKLSLPNTSSGILWTFKQTFKLEQLLQIFFLHVIIA